MRSLLTIALMGALMMLGCDPSDTVIGASNGCEVHRVDPGGIDRVFHYVVCRDASKVTTSEKVCSKGCHEEATETVRDLPTDAGNGGSK